MKKSFFFVILLFLIISVSGLYAADTVRIAILDFEEVARAMFGHDLRARLL